MSKLRWYFHRGLDQVALLTLLAWLGVLSLILVTVLLWLPSQRQIAQQPDLSVNVPKVIHMPTRQMTQLDSFFSAMPRVQQVSQSIETLFLVATNHQINLQEVVYRDELKSGESILRYGIEFTVQNDYLNIKAFLTELLAAIPYLALKEISFERDSIDVGEIQTHFKFTLYFDHE